MVFEPSKESNRIATPFLPSWRKVWGILCVMPPFLLLGVLLATEFNLLKVRLPLGPSLTLGVVEVGFILVVWLVAGPCVWLIERLTKRILRIDEDGIHVERSGKWKIPWRHIRSIRVEPVNEHNECKWLTVQYVRKWAPKRPYAASYVFTDAQCEAAVLELKRRKEAAGASFPIKVRSSTTAFNDVSDAHWWKEWVMSFSVIPFFQGAAMLAVGVFFWSGFERHEAYLRRVFGGAMSWIPSHELRLYLLIAGLLLTAVGGVGMHGMFAMIERRKKLADQLNLDGVSS